MRFPDDPKQKRELWNSLQTQAPLLVADINTLRDCFATARLTYVKVGGVEYGTLPPGITPVVNVPTEKSVERIEAERKAKKGREAKKRK